MKIISELDKWIAAHAAADAAAKIDALIYKATKAVERRYKGKPPFLQPIFAKTIIIGDKLCLMGANGVIAEYSINTKTGKLKFSH